MTRKERIAWREKTARRKRVVRLDVRARHSTRGTEMHATNCVPGPNLCTC